MAQNGSKELKSSNLCRKLHFEFIPHHLGALLFSQRLILVTLNCFCHIKACGKCVARLVFYIETNWGSHNTCTISFVPGKLSSRQLIYALKCTLGFKQCLLPLNKDVVLTYSNGGVGRINAEPIGTIRTLPFVSK